MAYEVPAQTESPISVTPQELEQVTAILNQHLPGRNVWAFGSRATGARLKRFSDLDLLIDGPDLSLLESELLREAFDESPLPFKVDIVESGSITPEFKQRIAENMRILIEHERL